MLVALLRFRCPWVSQSPKRLFRRTINRKQDSWPSQLIKSKKPITASVQQTTAVEKPKRRESRLPRDSEGSTFDLSSRSVWIRCSFYTTAKTLLMFLSPRNESQNTRQRKRRLPQAVAPIPGVIEKPPLRIRVKHRFDDFHVAFSHGHIDWFGVPDLCVHGQDWDRRRPGALLCRGHHRRWRRTAPMHRRHRRPRRHVDIPCPA